MQNYDLYEAIAIGATSTVYRATCKRGRLRNRLVAVKKVSLEVSVQDDHLMDTHTFQTARNVSENVVPPKNLTLTASLQATLCHPSVVSLISFFMAPSGFYQVMGYCKYGSLADFLATRELGVLTEGEVRGIARMLIDTLLYLRKERVLHRDVKPSHLLIASDYRVASTQSAL